MIIIEVVDECFKVGGFRYLLTGMRVKVAIRALSDAPRRMNIETKWWQLC
jgi:hypothetical protein